jgi:hypothetical protein
LQTFVCEFSAKKSSLGGLLFKLFLAEKMGFGAAAYGCARDCHSGIGIGNNSLIFLNADGLALGGSPNLQALSGPNPST